MKEETNPIFITGLFRCGTTMFGKALNVHPKITIASDPYYQFLKAFRNEIYKKHKKDFDNDSPVSDNFFSETLEADRELRNSNLNVPIKAQSINTIKKNIIPFCEFNSPKIVPLLKKTTGKTYKEFYNQLISIAKEAYGKENIKYMGIKNVFAENFNSPLINTYKNMRVIQLLRDPRAVLASQNKDENDRYPILFIIRQWRKSVACALDNLHKTENFLALRYESIVENPEEEVGKTCDFLDIKFVPEMIDPSNYTGRFGEKWQSNSAYGKADKITTTFKEKWKKVLSKEEIQLVEDLCEPEMKILGYERVTKPNTIKTITNPMKPYTTRIQDWIKPYLKEFKHNQKEMNKELIRHLLIHSNRKQTEKNKDFLDSIFMTENFLTNIKQNPFKIKN
ncbi:sulfotransferase [archaeon]|nr:sulfotransferase [archaeon]